jgi:hypothetical protein
LCSFKWMKEEGDYREQMQREGRDDSLMLERRVTMTKSNTYLGTRFGDCEMECMKKKGTVGTGVQGAIGNLV